MSIKETMEQIKALPDEKMNGGIFTYDQRGSQDGELDVADIKALAEQGERVERLRAGLLEAGNQDCKNRYSFACPSTPLPRSDWCGRCIAVVVLDSDNKSLIEAVTQTIENIRRDYGIEKSEVKDDE